MTGQIPSRLGNLANLEEPLLEFDVLTGPLPSSLTGLPNIELFNIEGTDVCVPTDAAVQTWVTGIPEFASSELVCGETPTSLTVSFEPADYTLRRRAGAPTCGCA